MGVFSSLPSAAVLVGALSPFASSCSVISMRPSADSKSFTDSSLAAAIRSPFRRFRHGCYSRCLFCTSLIPTRLQLAVRKLGIVMVGAARARHRAHVSRFYRVARARRPSRPRNPSGGTLPEHRYSPSPPSMEKHRAEKTRVYSCTGLVISFTAHAPQPGLRT